MDIPPGDDYRNADVARYAALLAVNHDRSKVGLPPLEYTEFISIGNLLRGAREYWTPQKLAEKAKKQLRDPKTKRWVTQRGNLGLHRRARARLGQSDSDTDTDTVDALQTPRAVAKGPGWGDIGYPPPESPTTKVTRLSSDAGIEAMVKAGHTRKLAEARYRGRGVIFQVDNPGRNPIHVFVANPKGMVEYRMSIQDNNVAAAESAIAGFKDQYAAELRARHPEAVAKLRNMEATLAEAERIRAVQKIEAEKHYGVGGDEVIGEKDQLLAAEAAAIHMDAISGWPAWRLLQEDGTPLPFVIEFDESKLLDSEGNTEGERDNAMGTVAKIFSGKAADGNRIILPRSIYRKPINEIRKGWFSPSDRTTVGQHASAHEPGHLLDRRGESWSSNNPAFKDFIDANHEAGADPEFPQAERISGYAKHNSREWYAEMHALASQDPRNLSPGQRVAIMAWANMFMLQHAARPEHPTTSWIAANQQWQAQAVAALTAVPPRRPPALPNPAEFLTIPKAKVYKNPNWRKPGQKKK